MSAPSESKSDVRQAGGSSEREPSIESPQKPDHTAPASAPTTGPVWPPLAAEHPLAQLQTRLLALLEESAYDEIYGVTLSATAPIPFATTLILQKFLRANANDVDKAAAQLAATLKWRKEFRPLEARDEVFDEKRFGGLGYVTVLDDVPSGSGDKEKRSEIVTWNIYGAVKDAKATFEDLDGFLRWRVALMEHAISHLNLSAATTPIPDYSATSPTHDPHQMIQVHDYLSVKFLRMDAHTRAASRKTIDTFAAYYPEMLSRKFFVNVPVVMGWVFGAMKLVLAKETVRKFTVLSYGEELVGELGKDVPRVYGGDGEALNRVGDTVRLA
ncbi:MAG: hypothetical protein M1819_001673 [Sarea resinae]|nr:MAG: hypothetical protein M1819_001673 [Sarea resinae]